MSPASAAARRRAMASAEAERYGGALSRRLLRELGVDRNAAAREVAQERWRTWGRQTIAMHTGPLSPTAEGWRAVWEVGHGIAVLDGVSALGVAGLRGFTESVHHVSIPHGCRPDEVDGIDIHQVRRRGNEIMGAGVPRTRPEVAAVRAARWAVSDRQAALLLVMPVQQRLLSGARLLLAARTLGGRGRSAFITQVAMDIADGAQSLGELDFAGMCRRRGLPSPSRQVVRCGPRGRVYLDVRWDHCGLVVEIDGSHHGQGLGPTDDHLRQNAVTLTGDRVLRISLIGLRVYADTFLDQVAQGLGITGRSYRTDSRAPIPRTRSPRVAG